VTHLDLSQLVGVLVEWFCDSFRYVSVGRCTGVETLFSLCICSLELVCS